MEVRVGIEASRVVDDTRAPRSNPGGGDRRRELPREKRFSREWRIQRGP
jgi:hypothetical protein